jgi:PAS domain S-box-containing protein
MHPLLARQLDRLGLTPDAPPDAEAWARLIGRIDGAYTQADQARVMVERSMEISSREMQGLHDRLRGVNDALEEKVRMRTAELQRLNANLKAEIEERIRTEAALAESEGWIRLVNDSLPVLIGYVDSSETFRYHNRAYRDRFAGPEGGISGRTVREVLGPDAYGRIRPHIALVLSGRRTQFERTHRSASGAVSHFACEFLPDVSESGLVLGYYAMLVDVTAQKQAEVTAVQNETRFRRFAELSSDWYWELDADHRFTSSTGLTDPGGGAMPADHQGLCPWEIPGSHPLHHTWDLQRARMTAREPFQDVIFKREVPGTEAHYMSVSGVPIFDEAGAFTGYRGVTRDITRLKQAEEQGLNAREVLAKLVDAVPDPIFVKDDAHRYMLVNDAACAFFGRPREALLGKSDHDFFPKEEADVFWAKDDEAFAAGVDIVNEESCSAGGDTRTVSTKKRSIRLPDGRQVLVGVLRDITDLKQRQRELSIAKEAAEAGSRAKSEFLARMSHEIRTPMNGVLGMTEILRGTPLTREQRGFLDTVHGSGVALLRIINDILDFSKVEAGRLELDEVDFILAECIGDTVDLLRGRAAAKRLPIAVKIAEGLPRVFRGDSARLRQILMNLVGNAVKFAERGAIVIRVDRAAGPGDAGMLRFEVSDEGIGVAPDAQAQIFDAFAQADGSTSRRYGGTGLGLAICRQLVHLMGGMIGVDSQPGQGATFWFTLRLEASSGAVPVGGASVSSVAAADTPHDAPALDASGVRVLLAEDNPVNRQVALAMLRSLGLAADTAVNGREAVEATARQAYDLVLMDCQMPELDGFAATAAIRLRDAAAGSARVPIVALTANAMTGDREACIAGGMDDYLSKPFTRAQLQEMLHKWVSGPEGCRCAAWPHAHRPDVGCVPGH